MPQLGPLPSTEAVLKYFNDRRARERAVEEARLAALDEQQCAIRFWIAVASSQNNPPVLQEMQRRAILAANKVIEAQPGMTQERLGVVIQREGQARGEKLTDQKLREEYVEELNACELRYGLSVTRLMP
jgi:hypothetical protein